MRLLADERDRGYVTGLVHRVLIPAILALRVLVAVLRPGAA